MGMKVFLMRGLPGAGKSTWVNDQLRHYQGSQVCSADTYHVRASDGVYDFKPENIKAAHDECFRDFLTGLKDTENEAVFVDNTNLALWELAPYYRVAEIKDCEVLVVQLHCPFELAVARNIHQVPPERIWDMQQTLLSERLPPHYKRTVLSPRHTLKEMASGLLSYETWQADLEMRLAQSNPTSLYHSRDQVADGLWQAYQCRETILQDSLRWKIREDVWVRDYKVEHPAGPLWRQFKVVFTPGTSTVQRTE